MPTPDELLTDDELFEGLAYELQEEHLEQFQHLEPGPPVEVDKFFGAVFEERLEWVPVQSPDRYKQLVREHVPLKFQDELIGMIQTQRSSREPVHALPPMETLDLKQLARAGRAARRCTPAGGRLHPHLAEGQPKDRLLDLRAAAGDSHHVQAAALLDRIDMILSQRGRPGGDALSSGSP